MIGKILKTMRRESNLTQEDISKKTYTPHIKIELFLQKNIIAENLPVLQHFQKPLGANQK